MVYALFVLTYRTIKFHPIKYVLYCDSNPLTPPGDQVVSTSPLMYPLFLVVYSDWATYYFGVADNIYTLNIIFLSPYLGTEHYTNKGAICIIF